eukprot:2217671-Ditylum_brightwellii.AAC.1
MQLTLYCQVQKVDLQGTSTSKPSQTTSITTTPPSMPPIHTECQTIKSMVCLTAEAECSGVFHNDQTTIVIRRILKELGYPQQPTAVKTDNATAN